MIPQTKTVPVGSSGEFSLIPSTLVTSPSRTAGELCAREGFWEEWLRTPELDLAESVIRLRAFRGMSQADLALGIGTKQPAVSRIEAALANPRLSTLTELARGLRATVRVVLEPEELLTRETQNLPWWERESASTALLGEPIEVAEISFTAFPLPRQAHVSTVRETPLTVYAVGPYRSEELEVVSGKALPNAPVPKTTVP